MKSLLVVLIVICLLLGSEQFRAPPGLSIAPDLAASGQAREGDADAFGVSEDSETDDALLVSSAWNRHEALSLGDARTRLFCQASHPAPLPRPPQA
jgi:hypothetical protein